MRKLIIGLIGEKGSGKGTFAKIIQQLAPKNSVSYIRYSDILVETLKLWSLSLTRSNYQNLAESFEKTFGSGTLSNAIKNKLRKLPGKIIILDGIRRSPEADLIKSNSSNLIIYITADAKTRFRNLKKGGDKTGEKDLSFEEFTKEEGHAAETLIPKIGAQADFKIINNGSLEDFSSKVEEFYAAKVKQLLQL